MIVDVTGKVLTPGNLGKDCAGNGEGARECCCDECDYLRCCISADWKEICRGCSDPYCPRCAGVVAEMDLSE